MKSQDTIGALDTLGDVAPAHVRVVCAQNGVANELFALRRFSNVYGICVMLPSGHLRPGEVHAYSTPTLGILDIGRFPQGTDATTGAIARALSSAGFVSEARPDIMRWKYAKLVMNLANAVEATCGAAGDGAEVAALAREEGLEVLRAAGIDVASDAEFAARRGDLIRPRPVAGGERAGSSSWQSLERRTGSVEVDYLNGEIVALGRLHGVATPVNALLQDVMHRMAREHRRPGDRRGPGAARRRRRAGAPRIRARMRA